ncbi:O-antigen ligase family protein [bacterium]|nr:hypothetical protein [bacterium]MBU3954899.1 O-antigen ligase family protein [bacterium]
MKSKLNRDTLIDLIQVTLFMLLFIAPVLFVPHFLRDGFGIPKNALNRILGSLIFVLWAVKKSVSKESFKLTSLSYAAAAFVFFAGLATILSADPAVSFYGLCPYYEWGFINIFVCFLLFIVVADEFNARAVPNLALMIYVAATVVCAYGIIQILGIDMYYKAAYSFNRIFSTMGNPNFLAGWLVTVFPLILAGYFGASGKSRLPLLFLLLTLGVNLGMTLSRAGFIAGIAATAVMLITLGKENLKKQKSWAVLFLSAAFFIFVIFLSGRKSLNDFEDNRSLISERIGVIADLSEGSASARYETWKTAFRMFKDNVFFGVGPNMFQYIFPKYETLKFARLTGGTTFSNYAHNTFLQVASTMGLFGLMAYVFLWGSALLVGLKKVIASEGKERLFYAGLLASLTALLVFLQFHFFLNETMLYFWVFLGILSAAEKPKEILLNGAARISLVIFSLVAAVFYWNIAVRNIFADKLLFEGKAVEAHRIFPQSVFYARYAVAELRGEAAAKQDINLMHDARRIATENAEKHPNNTGVWNDLGAVDIEFTTFGNMEFLDEAGQAFMEAYKQGPYKYKHVLDLSKYYEFRGDIKSAEKYMEACESIRRKS